MSSFISAVSVNLLSIVDDQYIRYVSVSYTHLDVYKRQTLSIAKPFISDIRINYEKYFYNEDATPKVSEQDKFVIEFMTRF